MSAATVLPGAPTLYQTLLNHPGLSGADLSSLRFCTSGGAPLPVPLVEKYTHEKNIRFKQGFGMTEFGPGSPGYLGGRWWEDLNHNGIMDETDHYFLCPLLPPGRPTPE